LYFIIAIFVIARAGKIISDEHNTGSIRLLFTQGISRINIFISKVISIIIDIIIHYFVFTIIFLLIGLFFYNFNDLLLPNISVINNNIVLSNFFIDFIVNIFMVMIPILFIMMLSIFISVISWNTIASIGIPLFINLIGPSTLGFLKSRHIGGIIPYTPFPYLDISKFITSFYGNYPENYSFVTTTYNINIGFIVIIIWTILLFLISMVIFNKRDIVND
jgi:ABC-2 type transport system permease protein